MNKSQQPMPHPDDRFKFSGPRQITNSRHLFPSEVRTIKYFVRCALRDREQKLMDTWAVWLTAARLVAQFARH